MGFYSKTLYPATESDVKDGINPPPVPRHKPFPQTVPIVRTRFVSNHNSVGFVRKKAQTISFLERGFERLGLSHQTVSLSWCLYMINIFALGIFLQEVGWEALVFGHFFPPSLAHLPFHYIALLG